MRRFVISIAVVLLTAVGVTTAWRLRPIRETFYTDADRIKVPAASAPLRDILWQPPVHLPEFNSGGDDYEPRLSADGMTLYFVRGKAGQNADIYAAQRTHLGWSSAQPVAGINSLSDDLGPEPTADGQSLYFYSNREGGLGGYDLWVSRRKGESWGEPTNLGLLVNSEFNDYGPAVAADGTIVYFASNRPRPNDEKQPDPNAWPATLREDLFYRTYDLYAAARTDGGFVAARYLEALNTSFNEGAPAVSPFGDFLYFASDRSGGEGAFDLYRSRFLRGEFLPAQNLGAPVNTAANELDPALSLGGYALYFSSDRPLSVAGPATGANSPATPAAQPSAMEESQSRVSTSSQRDYNLYQTTSREVFSETHREDRAPIDWAAFWAAVGPNLLWALLALLLLLAMLALYRSLRDRKLSLLARCLLASMAAHLLLMLLLNTLEVAAAMAGEFRRGRIQVALAAPSGEGIARQILGGLSEIERPEHPSVEAMRATLSEPPPASIETLSLPMRIETTRPLAAERLDVAVQADDARPEPTRIEFEPSRTESPAPATASTDLQPRLPADVQRIAATESEPAQTPSPVPNTTESPVSPSIHAEAVALSPAVRFETAGDDLRQPAQTFVPAMHVTESAPVRAATFTLGEAAPRPVEILPLSLTIAALPAGVTAGPVVEERASIAAAASDTPARPLFDSSADSLEVTTTVPRLSFAQSHAPAFSEPLQPSDVPLNAMDSSPERFDLQKTLEVEPPDLPPASVQTMTLSLPAVEQVRVLTPEGVESLTPTAVPTATSSRADFPKRIDLAALPTLRAPVELDQSAVVDSHRSLAEVPAFADAKVAPAANFRQAEFNGSEPQVSRPPSETLRLSLPAAAATQAPDSEPMAAGQQPHPASSPSSRANVPIDLVSVSNTNHPALPLTPTNAAADTGPSESSRAALLSDFSEPLPHDVLPAHEASIFASVTSQSQLLDLGMPTEELAPERPLMQRLSPERLELARQLGGSDETERAVERALEWLAAHQSHDGRWDADGFEENCGQCGGVTEVVADNALTGLSLMCFLGAGHTHTKPGPYQENVRRGLDWLLSRQADNGDLRSEETLYSHGIAAIALSESFTLTADSKLRDPVQRAVRFIDRARHRNRGGWRYDPGQEGDTSVLGWQVMALKSAQMAGVDVPAAALGSAKQWLLRVESSSRPGLYAYQPGMEPTPSMTAEAMFTQLLLGLEPTDPRLKVSAEFILEHLPNWDEDPNTYFWYYASLALLQQQGPAWERWNAAVSRELVEHQRRDGRAAGSWDPVGEWAEVGGRVYQTAICTLILEVYYRYLPLYSPAAAVPLELPESAVGAIRGSVRDAVSGRPVPGATVRLSLADSPEQTAVSNEVGAYALAIPEVPEHFALSASAPGFVPTTKSIGRDQLQGDSLQVDFHLEPLDENVVVLEAEPQVHHLGDNQFDGQINSQFQKRAEGDRYETAFELSLDQIGDALRRAEVVLLAKGVQRRHRLAINGTTLEQRLEEAPEDGSFGEFTAAIAPGLLVEGRNTLEIVAAPSSSDIDDFEFVNIRIRLFQGESQPTSLSATP